MPKPSEYQTTWARCPAMVEEPEVGRPSGAEADRVVAGVELAVVQQQVELDVVPARSGVHPDPVPAVADGLVEADGVAGRCHQADPILPVAADEVGQDGVVA